LLLEPKSHTSGFQLPFLFDQVNQSQQTHSKKGSSIVHIPYLVTLQYFQSHNSHHQKSAPAMDTQSTTSHSSQSSTLLFQQKIEPGFGSEGLTTLQDLLHFSPFAKSSQEAHFTTFPNFLL